MRALTLCRPWPFCILRLGKEVENRAWAPPRHLIGQDVALHAGDGWDARSYRKLQRRFAQLPVYSRSRDHPAGIVAIARLARVVTNPSELPPLQRQRWWIGPVGHVLEDIRELPRPIPCRGALGYWTVPDEIARQIVDQLQEVRT
jgi:hypothetical protein